MRWKLSNVSYRGPDDAKSCHRKASRYTRRRCSQNEGGSIPPGAGGRGKQAGRNRERIRPEALRGRARLDARRNRDDARPDHRDALGHAATCGRPDEPARSRCPSCYPRRQTRRHRDDEGPHDARTAPTPRMGSAHPAQDPRRVELAVMPIESSIVGAAGAPMVSEIDSRWTMAYAAALGDSMPCYMDTMRGVIAHPMFPVCFEWPVQVAMRAQFEKATSLTRDEAMRGVHA